MERKINSYDFGEILGTNKTRVDIYGKIFIIDTYLFQQQLGTFMNSNDEYRLNFLIENGNIHTEEQIPMSRM